MVILAWVSEHIGLGNILELIAIIVAAITIRKSVKQDLFEKRMESYIFFKVMTETYQSYMRKVDKHPNPTQIPLRDRYKWLTNNKELRDIENILDSEDIKSEIKHLEDVCMGIAVRAEEISLLWSRHKKEAFAKIGRDFIRLYSQLLICLARYERYQREYQILLNQKTETLQKIPSTKDVIMGHIDELTNKKIKMLKMEEQASHIDDQLHSLYIGEISYCQQRKWWQRNKNKELIGLIKDSIRP